MGPRMGLKVAREDRRGGAGPGALDLWVERLGCQDRVAGGWAGRAHWVGGAT